MKKIYLITYIEDKTIEGFIENLKDFDEWLLRHNRERREEGELIEYKSEFEIKEIWGLI